MLLKTCLWDSLLNVSGTVNVINDLGVSPTQWDANATIGTSNSNGNVIRLAFREGPDGKALIEAARETSVMNSYLAFKTRNTNMVEQMRITSSGKVGIGTSVPAAMLHVNSVSAGAKGSVFRGDTSQTANLTEWQNDSGTVLASFSSAGYLGLDGATPTYPLTFPQASTGAAFYNTSDQTMNFERATLGWASNIFRIETTAGGTGTVRHVVINGAGTVLQVGSSGVIVARNGTTANLLTVQSTGQLASSGTQYAIGAMPMINQSGTAGYTALLVNPTESATGSGTKLIADFQLGGVSKVAITNTGNVGIGTVNPASTGAQPLKLDVEGAVGATSYCDSDGNNCFSSASIAGGSPQGSDRAIQFNNNSSGFGGASTFVYTSTGRVGIGTSAPFNKLHVSYDGPLARFERAGVAPQALLFSEDTNGHTIAAYSPPTNAKGITFNVTTDSSNTVPSSGAVAYNFQILGSLVMRMVSSGYMGIGTTLPTSMLQVNTASAGAAGLIVKGSASQTANLLEMQNSAGTALALFSSSGRLAIGKATPTAEIDIVGDIKYTGDITDVSDRRLKKDIKPLEERGSMLDKIGQVKTYSFVMKDDKAGRTEFGVMAQELEPLFPELVRTASDEMGTKSVNYIGLIAPLIEAVREQQQEIRDQQREINLLRRENNGLARRLTDLETREWRQQPGGE